MRNCECCGRPMSDALELDEEFLLARRGDRVVKLTRRQYAMAELFIRRPSHPVYMDYIADMISDGDIRSVYQTAHKLRSKLKGLDCRLVALVGTAQAYVLMRDPVASTPRAQAPGRLAARRVA